MMSMPALPLRPLTLQDVAVLADTHEHRLELAEGNLVVMPPESWRHQQISALLGVWPEPLDELLDGEVPELG
ncbi:hypothetical protein [Dactylosporangium maewongense]|uniref:hypothetical protein n=1 Tax=Dactylosporangium maewongense TaxID=634393 RepID=UPI0031E2ED05